MAHSAHNGICIDAVIINSDADTKNGLRQIAGNIYTFLYCWARFPWGPLPD